MTDKFDPENPEHIRIKEQIEYGNNIVKLKTLTEIDRAIEESGLTKEETTVC